MRAALFTLIVVIAAAQSASAVAAQPGVGSPGVPCDSSEGVACGQPGNCGHHGHVSKDWISDQFGQMPQTCYSPRFGCYPGNGRDIQRYPAFHGTYYRNPYNYRQLFDYPWSAGTHEPVGYFAYQIQATDVPVQRATPTLAPAPPKGHPPIGTTR
jgi:hypothetical protein